MAILNQFASAMKDGSTLQIQMKKTATGTELTFIPIIEGIEADTEDEAKAAFQAAASRPFAITVSDDEVIDEVLTAHVGGISAVHKVGQEALSDYRARVDKAVAEAREREQAAKDAKEKKKADEAAKKKADAEAKRNGKGKSDEKSDKGGKASAPQATPALDLFSSAALDSGEASPGNVTASDGAATVKASDDYGDSGAQSDATGEEE